MDFSKLARLIENEAMNGERAYTMMELFGDLRKGIFNELSLGAKIDPYRRNLQRAYIERLEYLLTKEQSPIPSRFANFVGFTSIDVSQSDIRPIARAELNKIKTMATGAARTTGDPMSKYHLEDLVARIDLILSPK